MRVTCEGGILDGQVLDKAEPEPTIHQNGLMVLKVHLPYPKRRGERVIDRLLTWTEDYHLHQTEAGPVYRCVSPFNDKEIIVGGETVARGEGGAFHVYADRDGKLHARPCVAVGEEAG